MLVIDLLPSYYRFLLIIGLLSICFDLFVCLRHLFIVQRERKDDDEEHEREAQAEEQRVSTDLTVFY